jgi:hypothetical protein
MLDYEYTRVRNIPLTELHNPEYSAVLIKYAGRWPLLVLRNLFSKSSKPMSLREKILQF